MKVLALDPSSTITGYALMTDSNELVDAGRFKPDTGVKGATARIRSMRDDLTAFVEQHTPDVIVLEITSGKVGKRHGGGGAGLATYGMGVGGMVAEAEHCCRNVVVVTENEWTCGVRKVNRQLQVANLYPEYRDMMKRDLGGDVSDAIGICMWWFRTGQYQTVAG